MSDHLKVTTRSHPKAAFFHIQNIALSTPARSHQTISRSQHRATPRLPFHIQNIALSTTARSRQTISRSQQGATPRLPFHIQIIALSTIARSCQTISRSQQGAISRLLLPGSQYHSRHKSVRPAEGLSMQSYRTQPLICTQHFSKHHLKVVSDHPKVTARSHTSWPAFPMYHITLSTVSGSHYTLARSYHTYITVTNHI